MALRVDVDKRELDKLARNLRQAAKATPVEVDKALLKAGGEVEKAIRGSTDTYMPKGYEKVFKAALVIKVQLHRGATRRVELTGRAYGRRGHDRQVENLERGLLRHPVFSSDRKRWAKLPQRIKPGWMTVPMRESTPQIVVEIDKGAKAIANHIGQGL